MTIDDSTVADALRDLQITHGNPTAEELAIVAAIVSATGLAQHSQPVPSAPPSRWSDPSGRLDCVGFGRSGWTHSLRRR